jgi:hypothetical protein
MPRYRVLTRSYIAGDIREADEIVTYNGKPGSNLELVTPQAPRRRKVDAPAPEDEKPPETTE